jgi:hypothetical protein
VIHGKPVIGDFPVQVLIADSSLFQSGPERFRAPIGDEMLHRDVDEPTSLPRLGHPVNGLDSCLRKNDVDAFAHRERLMILYTQYKHNRCVCQMDSCI